MATANTIVSQTKYGKVVIKNLDKTAVFTNANGIVNRYYEGDPKSGSVKIPTQNDASVVVYNKTNGISNTVVDSGFLSVTDFLDYGAHEIVDNYDAATVPVTIVANRMERIGKAFQILVDTQASAVAVAEGTKFGDDVALTQATTFSTIVDLNTAMDEAGVPTEGRVLIISPKVRAALVKSEDFVKQSESGQSIVKTGKLGEIDGFAAFISNNMPANVELIAVHPEYFTQIIEWTKEPYAEDKTGGDYIGAVGIKGRLIFKHKVLNALSVLYKTKA